MRAAGQVIKLVEVDVAGPDVVREAPTSRITSWGNMGWMDSTWRFTPAGCAAAGGRSSLGAAGAVVLGGRRRFSGRQVLLRREA